MTRATTKVILHGDDMGATEKVTERMIEAWKNGYLSSFSVLANGDALIQVSTELCKKSGSDARISAHLNLSEGPSLCNPSDVPLIVDEKGLLCRGFGDLLKSLTLKGSNKREQLLSQVEKEWRYQIETIQKACAPRTITSLDGHVHVHMLPHLFTLAIRLANDYKVPQIRLSREPFYFSSRLSESLNSSFCLNVIKHFVLKVCSELATPVRKIYPVNSPDALVGVLYTGQMTSSAAMSGISAARKQGAREVEVVFHIGRAGTDESSRWDGLPEIAPFYLSPERDREYDELKRFAKESSWLTSN